MGNEKTSTVANEELEHTRGGATTRDSMDAGVPMTPGSANEPIGPEDALGPGPKRGDYRDRLNGGPSMVTRVIPEDERRKRAEAVVKAAPKDSGMTLELALGDVPRTELVPAGDEAGNIGDAPGKGGVSTEEARGRAAELAEAAGAPAVEETA